MNEEIKEINIKIPGQILDYVDTKEHLLDLFNYITNLKQRCEYLERSNDRREDTILGLRQEIYEQEDYKSRCLKASDKLGNYKHYLTPTEEQNRENEDIVDSALNILQNGSDSQ